MSHFHLYSLPFTISTICLAVTLYSFGSESGVLGGKFFTAFFNVVKVISGSAVFRHASPALKVIHDFHGKPRQQ